MLNKGDLVIVSGLAPFHSGRVGYFQFYGMGKSEGCAILADTKDPSTLFAVEGFHCFQLKDVAP